MRSRRSGSGAACPASPCLRVQRLTGLKPPSVRILETLETRVIGDYDVVVAGGGASGLVAALAAAREGARTALIERTSCLGGTATAGMVAQWLGFYNHQTRVVGGLAMELARRVCGLGGSDG